MYINTAASDRQEQRRWPFLGQHQKLLGEAFGFKSQYCLNCWSRVWEHLCCVLRYLWYGSLCATNNSPLHSMESIPSPVVLKGDRENQKSAIVTEAFASCQQFSLCHMAAAF
eukprot:scaffold248564_cov16-Tisochrysis_lutea.AAC.1